MDFLTGEPVVILRDTVVVADLHIGIEAEYFRNGIKLPSQTEKMVKRLDEILDETQARRIVIAGDLKHKVPGTTQQETREIPAFLKHLAFRSDVALIPGNHDGGISSMLPNKVALQPTEGLLLGDTFICHGHAWPSWEFLNASYVVIGHTHPMIEFRDSLGYRWQERVWVRARLNEKAIREKYGKVENVPELIIMPAFNDYAGGVALNRDYAEDQQKNFIGPLINNVDMNTAKVYMLDGTFLGELGNI